MRINLLNERATLTADGVLVDTRNDDSGTGMTSKPYTLDGPFGIALQYDFQGSGGHGSITLADQQTSDPWWKDAHRAWVTNEGSGIHLDIYDGTSDHAVANIPLRGLDPSKLFYIVFPDSQGKRLTILDKSGAVVEDIDVTKLGQGALANGLFPQSMMYVGFVVTPQSQMTVHRLSLLAPPESNLFQVYKTVALETPPLRELARQRDIKLGVEIDLANMEFYNDARYRQIVAQEFDNVTSGYGTSWVYAIHPNSPDFDWSRTDPVMDFVKQAGLKFAWYNIVFASENTPEWLRNSGYSKDQILAFLQKHIQVVVDRYKDVVDEWGVVCEADWTGPTNTNQIIGFPATANGDLLGHYLDYKVGPDVFIPDAFQWTHEAAPKGVLTYINAYNEKSDPYSDFEYNFIKQMKQKGMPIDAIGFEMNLQASDFKSDADIQAWKDSVKQNMQRFGDLGLHVVITELTVNVGNVEGETMDEKLALQAKVYKAAVETCLESNGICNTIYLGGFTDNTSWLYYPGYPFGKAEAPNILDEQYKPKPAYFAIREAFLGK